MTPKPTILIDQDSVLAQWDDLFYTDFIAKHPELPMLHPTERTVFNMMLPEHAEYHDKILGVMDRPGFYAELEPIPGAADAIAEMVELGFDVAICTSPWLTNPTCVQDKLDWVERHIGTGWASRTIITKDKTRVLGDILIDDKPDITGAVAPVWRHVFFTQPYNAMRPGPRIDDWSQWRSVVEAELDVIERLRGESLRSLAGASA